MLNESLAICGNLEYGYRIYYLVLSEDGQTCTPYLYTTDTFVRYSDASRRLEEIKKNRRNAA